MKKMLTLQEREQLIARHRKERDKRVYDRIKAVLAYDGCYTYTEIARILLLDDETIRRHTTADKQQQQFLNSTLAIVCIMKCKKYFLKSGIFK